MSSPEIILYLRPGWSSLFPHILLHEQGLTFTTIGVTDCTVAEDAAFASKNPKKQIPVLLIDGQPVTENPAIAHAIQSISPANKLGGQSTEEFIRAWSPYLRPWRFTTDTSGEAAVKAKAYEKLCERFAMIESWLPDGGWAVGSAFTAVDAYLLPYYQWGEADLDLNIGGRHPKYAVLMKKVKLRPSVQKALEREAEIKERMGGDQAFEGNR